jgi:hypothetical protein
MDKHILLVPTWFIVVGFIILSFFGCKHTSSQLPCEEEPFVHTCPQKGHGNCPICFDTILQNEEVVVLDQ